MGQENSLDAGYYQATFSEIFKQATFLNIKCGK